MNIVAVVVIYGVTTSIYQNALSVARKATLQNILTDNTKIDKLLTQKYRGE